MNYSLLKRGYFYLFSTLIYTHTHTHYTYKYIYSIRFYIITGQEWSTGSEMAISTNIFTATLVANYSLFDGIFTNINPS